MLLVLFHFFYPFVFLQMRVMLLCFLFIFSLVNTVIHLKLTLFFRDVSNNDLCGTIPTSGPFEHIPLNKWVPSIIYHFVLLSLPFFFWLSNWNYSLTSTMGNTVLFYQSLRSSFLTPNYQKMKRVLCLLIAKRKRGLRGCFPVLVCIDVMYVVP